MAELRICRICLRTEAKTYRLDRFQLRSYYEEVMAQKVVDGDPLPHCACFECATQLHNFHRFKEKCYRGQRVLREMLRRGPLSYEAVYKINRAEKNLESPLEIMSASDKVKYYVTQDETLTNIKRKSKPSIEIVSDNSDVDINHTDEDVDDTHPTNKTVSKDLGKTDTKDIITIDEGQIISDTQVTLEDNVDLESTEMTESKSDMFMDIKDESIVDLPVEDPVASDIQMELTDIKDEAVVDLPVGDPVAIETNDVDMAPVIEFIDSKKKGVQQEQLIIKLKKSKICKRALDPAQWKRCTLTEETALAQFRARARTPRYAAAAHKCGACYRIFRTATQACLHANRHSESVGTFECRFCRLRFKYASGLRAHVRAHYTRLHCRRCSRVCQLENTALLHEESHSGVKKKCDQCGEEFRHRCSLYAHLRATHRSLHVCARCGAACVTARGLRRHQMLRHSQDQESSEDDDEVSTHCARCDIRFASRAAYCEHLFQSALHTECGEDQVKDDNTIPRKVQGKRRKAKILKEWSKNNSTPKDSAATLAAVDQPPEPKRRRKLKRKKLKRKPTTCYQCGQHFETQAECMSHHILAHPGTSFYGPGDRHVCEQCGASLAPSSVSAHQNMHSREKLFACETCGRAFHSAGGLTRHLVTHTGEKRYACALCDKRFTQNNSMKLHYRTAHLKQPYPKRNRRRNPPPPPPADPPVDRSGDLSEQSLPEAAPAQYLTLT